MRDGEAGQIRGRASRPRRASGLGRTLSIASYNVHAWAGSDGRRDAERTAEVLRELDADLVALQEVRCSGDDRSTLELIAKRLGVSVVRGLVLDRRDEGHGNAVLSRLPLTRFERFDLTVSGREPRGAIAVAVETGAEPLRVVATHLGIGVRERRVQVRRLLAALALDEPGAHVLLGDMNEWARGVGALVRLHRALGRTPGPRTFPATLPLFSLDRIWVVPRSRLQRIWVHRSAAARRASDHLPIVAELRLEPTVSANLVEAGSADPIDRPDHDPPLARSVHFALGKEVSRMDPFVLAPLLVVALGLLYLALSIHGRTGSGTERGDFLSRRESGRVGWALLWLLGVPIPVLLVLFLMRGCT